MRIRHKKLLVSGAAVTVAGVLGIGTLIQTSLLVKASSEMMPGIETIINENSGQKPFKILELTDSSRQGRNRILCFRSGALYQTLYMAVYRR